MVDADTNASGYFPFTTAPENSPRHISSLPPEILAQIFHMHREQHRDAFRDPEWVNDTPPSVRASHVCSTWRETALSEATLWTNLVSTTRSSTFYDAMVQRSKQSLLNIAIEMPQSRRLMDLPLPEQEGYRLCTAMIDRAANMLAGLVALHAVRLRELRIKAPVDFIDRHIPALRNVSAPNLTLVDIANATETQEWYRRYEHRPAERIFAGGAGKLSRFAARYVSRQIQPPLGALKTFVLITHAPVQLAEIHAALAELAPTIVHLVLHIPHTPRPALPPQRITMPALRLMELCTFFPDLSHFDDTANCLLDRLCLPALDDLTLQKAWAGAGPLVARSACKPAKLNVKDPRLEDVLRLLKVLPTVRELSILCFGPQNWGAMLAGLAFHRGGGAQLVPALRSLDVFTQESGLDVRCFAEMIASRWGPETALGCARLSRVKVTFSMGIAIPDPDLAPLRKFVREGLDLAIISVDRETWNQQRLL
ncbi:hypothetical protein FIBSPDRAFT_851718 [Athelia psychrophila]|uniref:F-box domain-containing protein n=1 Tax=Athelia psychrophila TaxID=1759441 RepID=A0A166SDE1_9AGAM|nr:hypothetical protein FIBSPDRAFT_851718 [Fibularhizoctonia sp. CBS 109695]